MCYVTILNNFFLGWKVQDSDLTLLFWRFKKLSEIKQPSNPPQEALENHEANVNDMMDTDQTKQEKLAQDKLKNISEMEEASDKGEHFLMKPFLNK